MSKKGQNLPSFQNTQLDFAAHIRNPERNSPPADIEPRRMAIYVRLFYNSSESICAKIFKKSKAILGHERWHELFRDFFHRHICSSPFFKDIPQEFIEYYGVERQTGQDPAFLSELLHYEWLKLYLDLDDEVVPESVEAASPLDAILMKSPLVHVLAYQWPVHEITEDDQPEAQPHTPTYLLAFRDRLNRVQFLKSNRFTCELVDALTKPRLAREALASVSHSNQHIHSENVSTIDALNNLIERDVLVVCAAEADPS